jgi:hypothetical protein
MRASTLDRPSDRADRLDMDLSALSVAVTSAKASNEAGVRVARTALDAQKQEGDAAVALLQQAAAFAKAQTEAPARAATRSIIDAQSGRVDTYA